MVSPPFDPSPATAPADGPPASSKGDAVIRTSLRILATTDLHSHVLNWDYDHDRPAGPPGLARVAALIRAARAEVPHSLLVDNGDFLQGSALAEQAAVQEGPPPVIRAMTHLGYAAAALGNHEFSLGMEVLDRALQGAGFPVLSANLVRRLGRSPLEDEPFLPASVLVPLELSDERGRPCRLVVGIIGFTPPMTTVWDGVEIGGRLVARGILQAARAHLPALRARGADLVVALCHSGLGRADAGDADENVATALAALGGIDAMVAGHAHQVFPLSDNWGLPELDARAGTACGIPVVMPGHHGTHLGVIDLRLERQPRGPWRVAAARARVRPVAPAGPAPDARVAALVAEAHGATRAALARPIGQLRRRLHSYFAQVADCPALRLVAEAQAAHVRARLAGGPYAGLPVLASVAPFKSGGRAGPEGYTDVPAGEVGLRHASDLYSHPNRIAALRLTGADLARWLDKAAGQFHRIAPGDRDAELIDPGFPSFNFETIHGLNWVIDLSEPAGSGHRIRSLSVAGRPVDPGESFVLATNSYRAAGSGGFPGAGPERQITLDGASLRAIVASHIASGAAARMPPFRPAWRLVAPPRCSALFQTSPAALPLLGEAAPLSLEDAGPGEGGFRRIRIRF